MAEEKNPAELYAPKIQEINDLATAKKKEIDEKLGEKMQTIEALMADLIAVPEELAGQSQEFIDRKTKAIQEKIDKQMEKVTKWMEEQQKKVEDWLNEKTQAIQDKINEEVIEKAKREADAAKLKAAQQLAIKTGQKVELPEDGEAPSVPEMPELPAIPEPMKDDEWCYSYKGIKGDFIPKLGTDVAKRKAYKGDIYSDEEEKLKKANIKREKYKWGFSWRHTDWDIRYVDGAYKMVAVKQETGTSSADEPLETLKDVFSFVPSQFAKFEGSMRKVFSSNAEQSAIKKLDRTSLEGGAAGSHSSWEITVNRFIKE